MGTASPSFPAFSPGLDLAKTPDSLLGLPPSPGPTFRPFWTPLRSSTSPGRVCPGTTPSRWQAVSQIPPHLPRPRVGLPRLSTIKLLRQREAPAWPEDAAQTHPELLPAITIPGECAAGRNVEEGRPARRGCPAAPTQSLPEQRSG